MERQVRASLGMRLGRQILPLAAVLLGLAIIGNVMFIFTLDAYALSFATILCGIIAPVVQTIALTREDNLPYRWLLIAIEVAVIVVSFSIYRYGDVIVERLGIEQVSFMYELGVPLNITCALIAGFVVCNVAFWEHFSVRQSDNPSTVSARVVHRLGKQIIPLVCAAVGLGLLFYRISSITSTTITVMPTILLCAVVAPIVQGLSVLLVDTTSSYRILCIAIEIVIIVVAIIVILCGAQIAATVLRVPSDVYFTHRGVGVYGVVSVLASFLVYCIAFWRHIRIDDPADS